MIGWLHKLFGVQTSPRYISAAEAIKRLDALPRPVTSEEYAAHARALGAIAAAEGDFVYAARFNHEADMLERFLRLRDTIDRLPALTTAEGGEK